MLSGYSIKGSYSITKTAFETELEKYIREMAENSYKEFNEYQNKIKQEATQQLKCHATHIKKK